MIAPPVQPTPWRQEEQRTYEAKQPDLKRLLDARIGPSRLICRSFLGTPTLGGARKSNGPVRRHCQRRRRCRFCALETWPRSTDLVQDTLASSVPDPAFWTRGEGKLFKGSLFFCSCCFCSDVFPSMLCQLRCVFLWLH